MNQLGIVHPTLFKRLHGRHSVDTCESDVQQCRQNWSTQIRTLRFRMLPDPDHQANRYYVERCSERAT